PPTVFHPHQHSAKFPICGLLLQHLSLPQPAYRRIRLLTGPRSTIPSVSGAERSGPASPRTAAASDVLPPEKASSSEHVSPVVRPSSPAAVASWSATSSRFAWATSAAATNCPDCRPAGSGGSPGCRFRRDSRGCGSQKIDPEPRGDGGVSDKTGWEGRGQQLGTRIGTVWTLSQALGQAKENIYPLESLDGYIVCS